MTTHSPPSIFVLKRREKSMSTRDPTPGAAHHMRIARTYRLTFDADQRLHKMAWAMNTNMSDIVVAAIDSYAQKHPITYDNQVWYVGEHTAPTKTPFRKRP